jgi:hypothetical protein
MSCDFGIIILSVNLIKAIFYEHCGIKEKSNSANQ